MALLWVDGFDSYGTGTSQVPDAILGWRYQGAAIDYNQLSDPRVVGNGRGLKTDYSSWTLTPKLTENRTLIVGFGFYLQQGASSGLLLEFWNRQNRSVHLKLRGYAGEIDVYGGPSEYQNYLGTTSGARLGFQRWSYIEVKVYCDSAAGTVDIHADGQSVLSLSGVNTQRISENFHDRIAILPDVGSNYVHFIDDFYLCDGSGTVNNDLLGPCKVAPLRPEADVTGEKDWILSSGTDHYALVDEIEANEDTDYVESDTVDDQDLWEYEDTPTEIGTIHGIQICTDCRITDAEVFDLKIPAKLGATTSEGSGQRIGSTQYLSALRVMETDPDTNPWTDDNLDDAQFGVKVA